MRSAIFESERRTSSSNRNLLKRKQASASPRINSSTGIHKRSELDKGKGRSSSPYIGSPQRFISWNLEEMITAYQESKALPPMLSPNLPDLSPDKITFNDPDDTPLIHLSSPEKQPKHKIDSINTNPTHDLIPKNKPSGKEPQTNPLPLAVRKKSRIRWVNKLNDPKPRFLLRFLYNAAKYNEKSRQPSSKEEFSGLGISVLNKRRISTPVNEEVETVKSNTPKSNATSHPSTPTKKSFDSASQPSTRKFIREEADSKYTKSEDFIKHKTYWIKLAKETKFISDKTDGVLSVIMQFDSLILFTISFDFDEKLKIQANIPITDSCWKQLLEEISHTVMKSKDELTKCKNESIKTYIRCLIGLLYQYNCIVLRKINTIYEQVVNQESDLPKKVELYEKIQKNLKEIDENSKQREINCPLIDFFIKSNFQEAWNKRVKVFRNTTNKLLPLDGSYYLPIGNYTQLQEFVKFLFQILNEFITIHNSIYKDDLIYSLKSGLSGPS